MSQTLEIDIAKIVESKAKVKLPRWGARLLQRLIHEREINDILRRHGDKSGYAFLEALHEEFDVQVRWLNPETLPADGRAIFVCNHPLGAFDGIGISYLLHQMYGDVRYMVNDMLYHLKPLQPVFLPVNTYGAQRRESVEQIQTIMQSSIPVGTFPAGYCSRYYGGRVQDREWQRSFIGLATTYERDIVPLHFVGRNSRHFYIIDRVRRALGIKFDLCTALLPDEMFRSSGKRFDIVVGEPIRWQSLATDTARAQDKAARIRELCYQLPEQYAERLTINKTKRNDE